MKVMKLVRRTHLYTGLFLAPWVAMYGISGFIFNHGNWFAPGNGDSANQPIEWSVDAAAMPRWPEPDELARKVVTAMNAANKDNKETYHLPEDGEAKFQGGISMDGQDDAGGSVFLSFGRRTLKGVTRHSPPQPQNEQIKVDANEVEVLNATKDAMLAAASKADTRLSATKWSGDGDFPRLSFLVEHASERHRANYDLRSGLVSLSPEQQALRIPNFLTALHMSHGYPSDAMSEKVITLRAVFVDAMAILMCFWALSGIAMWLQLKQLWRSGLLVAIASLLATAFVWIAMYQLFSRS